MHQTKQPDEQVEYLGIWTPKKYFRTFVYSASGQKKLANSWDEYKKLIATGEWFDSPLEVSEKPGRKPKNGADSKAVCRGQLSTG